MYCQLCVYTQEFSLNLNSNTLDPDQPQHDHSVTCHRPEVSSVPLSHCTFRPARKNLVHISKLISFLILIFLKLQKLEIPYAQESRYKEMSIYDLNANWAVLGIKMAEMGAA